MTLQQMSDAADLLRFLFSKGYDPIDLAPHNLIVEASGRLTAIDFELVRWQAVPVDPEQSECLRGRRDVLGGELPRGRLLRTDPYGVGWSPYTGLPLRSFLHDQAWLQAVKRVVYHPSYLVRRAIRHQLRWVRARKKSS
jgi:hypothetical protein